MEQNYDKDKQFGAKSLPQNAGLGLANSASLGHISKDVAER